MRSSAGRFVGNAYDSDNNNCKVMVLSTREQHIRRDKATSNICSNQSFIATAIGAALLAKGSEGLTQTYKYIEATTKKCLDTLTQFKGVELAFPHSPIVNEFVLKLPMEAEEFITKAKNDGILVGVNVSKRVSKSANNYLLISISDVHTETELNQLYGFFKKTLGEPSGTIQKRNIEIPAAYINQEKIRIKKFSFAELKNFYDKLGEQNVSPDNNIYPLGSCTMKYNPYINDWAASLTGFTNSHPEAPESEVQGNLEVLYEIQEFFKNLTGLPAVTTQPVAGAHGELCGMKMFQAYHKNNNEDRDIVIISASAHGTNPATVSMAGIETKVGVKGLVIVEANEHGLIKLDQLKELVEKYNKRICGIMITNPNTSGLFEVEFKKISDLIHSVGGLVYLDGANMNAISGYLNLAKMGVDAVHNNLHKTWSIPHEGGGPGDGIRPFQIS
ncbi:MAG: aminotransferase class V-fold PLP-dependent enzyme [Bacteriovoracaceae bacterium]